MTCVSGLVPRLVGEVMTLWMGNLLEHGINKYKLIDLLTSHIPFPSIVRVGGQRGGRERYVESERGI